MVSFKDNGYICTPFDVPKGDRLIKAQAACTILSRVVNFSVPSPYDNK